MKIHWITILIILLTISCISTPLDKQNLPPSKNNLETAIAQTVVANTIVKFVKTNITQKAKKVLFLGYDGVRADAIHIANTPAVDYITKEGGIYLGYAGGILGTKWQQQTFSAPGWATLLTGVWANQHKVITNITTAKLTQTPSFLKQTKKLDKNLITASIVHMKAINYLLSDEIDSFIDIHKEGISDIEVKDEAIKAITTENADILFIVFDDPDHIGHTDGFSPIVKEYTDQITLTDSYAKLIIDALKARADYDNEDWLIIITTDHGGIANNHGGQSIEERTTWIAINQPSYLTIK